MIKKGDTVYLVPADIRRKPYHATVTSVGRKYIKVLDSPDHNTYDIVTYESVTDKSGYNPNIMLYESEEAYNAHRYSKARGAYLKSKLAESIEKATLKELETLYEIVNKWKH